MANNEVIAAVVWTIRNSVKDVLDRDDMNELLLARATLLGMAGVVGDRIMDHRRKASGADKN